MFQKYSTKEILGYQKSLYSIKWNNEGNFLAVISGDRSVKISQFHNNALASSSSNPLEIVQNIPTSQTMSQVCWHPCDSSRLSLCSEDKAVELWDLRASKAAMKIQSLGSNINMDWSPCGNYLVLGNKSDYILVLDLRTGNQLKKKKFHYVVSYRPLFFPYYYHSLYAGNSLSGE
jgi:WD40 repeat protein